MRRLLTLLLPAVMAALLLPLVGPGGAARAAATDPTYVFTGTLGQQPSSYSHPVTLAAGDHVVARAICDEATPGSRPVDPGLSVSGPSGSLVYDSSDDGFAPDCSNYSSSCVEFDADLSGIYALYVSQIAGSPGPYTVEVYVNATGTGCSSYGPALTSARQITVAVNEPFTHTATGAGPGGVATVGYAGNPTPTGTAFVGNVLSGTPTTTGVYRMYLRITDPASSRSNYQWLTVVVTAPPAFSSAETRTGVYDAPFSHTFTATAYPAPTYSVDAEDLPAGLSLVGATLQGTPAETGTFPIEVTATNVIGQVTQGFVLTIDEATFTTGPTAAITGVAKVGETLTADTGSPVPAPDSFTYRWFADGQPITGADQATYTPTAAYVGTDITVVVTAHRTGYTDVADTSEPLGPVATDQAPGLTLTSSRSELRRGQSSTLTWSSTHADTVTASGDWTGTRDTGGSASVTPTVIGNHTYRLTATNDNGTTVAQVALDVRRPAARLKVSAPARAVAGTKIVVRTRGLDPKEAYRVLVGKNTVALGTADAHGRANATVKLSAGLSTGRTTLRVVGEEADRAGADVVVVRKPLAASVAHREIRASDRQVVTVRNLLPRQKATVRVNGKKVATARADRSGVAKVSFKASTQWGTYRVVARAGNQKATTTYQVVQRCPGHTWICP